jgi:hypothetical protein
MSGVWLFQINPKKQQAVNLRVGAVDAWDVTRYRHELHEGDQAIIWREGEQGGIVALGRLASNTFEQENPDFPGQRFWVNVTYTRIFERTLPRSTVKQNPKLHYMQIISIPFAQNPFSVTEDEWQELQGVLGIA